MQDFAGVGDVLFCQIGLIIISRLWTINDNRRRHIGVHFIRSHPQTTRLMGLFGNTHLDWWHGFRMWVEGMFAIGSYNFPSCKTLTSCVCAPANEYVSAQLRLMMVFGRIQIRFVHFFWSVECSITFWNRGCLVAVMWLLQQIHTSCR